LTHFSLNKSGNIKVTTTTTINVPKASVEKEQLDDQQASPDEFYECVEIQTEDSFKDTTSTPIATELRELLDTMMKDEKALEKASKFNAPPAIVFLAEHISNEIDHNKPKGATELTTTPNFLESYAKYHEFYKPGCLYFEVPKERQDVLPSPHYHAIEGTRLYHVD
jgi:hypothetical protein